MIKIENVTKSFDGFKALDCVNLNVKKGSVYGLVGANGAGKTTLIKTFMGIYKADSGSLSVNGETVYENTDVKQNIFYISDDIFFFTTYSILDMAKFYAGIYKKWDWNVFEKLKDIFKIDVKRKCNKLSKGMQKQVIFWIAISCRPEIMVLDEPVDGLDPVMRKNIWSLMLQEVSDREMTVLVSSHNLRELEDVCDHVGVMYNGKVVIEKALDDAKGDIHKVQTVFKDITVPEELEQSFDVLHKTKFGSVITFIIKGDANDIKQFCEEHEALVCDIVPLTLEEIFIYELGGMGYEFQNIIVQ